MKYESSHTTRDTRNHEETKAEWQIFLVTYVLWILVLGTEVMLIKGMGIKAEHQKIVQKVGERKIGIFSIFLDFLSISDLPTVSFLTFHSSLDSIIPSETFRHKRSMLFNWVFSFNKEFFHIS